MAARNVRVLPRPSEDTAALAVAALAPRDAADAARRRDDAVRRMRAARTALAAEMAGVAGIEALRDDEWSIVHVLKHLGGDGGGHYSPVYDMLERGQRELPRPEDRDERLARAVSGALAAMDGAIAFAEGLTADQLVRHARRDGREHYVVGFIEATAAHLEEHLAQLREIRVRLAAARERRAGASG